MTDNSWKLKHARKTWRFESSGMESKRMIVSNLLSAVRVSRDYELDFDFHISPRDLGKQIQL